MTNKTEPDLAGIEQAARTIRPYLEPTPLVRSELLSQALNADIWLKNETVTPIASFKLRGALNSAVDAHERGISGLVTSSTGNHGQGVAYAARLLDMKADIFLPNPANPVKARMIEAFGGTVHEVGEDLDVSKYAAIEYARRHGLTFIDDGNDIRVMEGAGTIGYEISRQLQDIDLVLIPLGGGNLAGGCAVPVKSLQPTARVITVQAKGSPAVTRSFHQKRAVECEVNTLADGLVTRVPPALALNMLWKNVDDAWLASDDELLAATHALMQSAHVLVEPAGAASLAGACRHKGIIRHKRVVLILTGANISSELFKEVLETEPIL